MIPSVESFQAEGRILARPLYVAMTRARSVLSLYGRVSDQPAERAILTAIEECLDALVQHPEVDSAARLSDEFEDILLAIGVEHRDWLERLRSAHRLVHEPMLSSTGAILCEPLFWYESGGRRFACFPQERPPSQRVQHDLSDAGVVILDPSSR